MRAIAVTSPRAVAVPTQDPVTGREASVAQIAVDVRARGALVLPTATGNVVEGQELPAALTTACTCIPVRPQNGIPQGLAMPSSIGRQPLFVLGDVLPPNRPDALAVGVPVGRVLQPLAGTANIAAPRGRLVDGEMVRGP